MDEHTVQILISTLKIAVNCLATLERHELLSKERGLDCAEELKLIAGAFDEIRLEAQGPDAEPSELAGQLQALALQLQDRRAG